MIKAGLALIFIKRRKIFLQKKKLDTKEISLFKMNVKYVNDKKT